MSAAEEPWPGSDEAPSDDETPNDMSSDELAAFDSEADVTCPHCGETVTIGLDPGGGEDQTYVEDCQVCCQPWRVHLRYDAGGVATLELEGL